MSVNLPVVNAPYLSVSGLQITLSGAADLKGVVAAGRARNSTNESDIILDSTLAFDMANVGINGIDQSGSLFANIMYYLYLVGDSTGNSDTGVIFSRNEAAPLLPVGYDMFRLIGYIRTGASAGLFLPAFYHGKANERIVMYETPVATAVTAGNSTTYGSVALANSIPILQGDYFPVFIAYDFTPGAASRNLFISPSTTSAGYAVKVTGQVTSVVVSGIAMVMSQVGASNIYYKVSNAGDAVALSVAGYQYTL